MKILWIVNMLLPEAADYLDVYSGSDAISNNVKGK